MKRLIAIALITAASLCGARSQDLKSLGKDSGISCGTLANGVDWYIVSNPCTKGHADFAVVQKDPSGPAASRQALTHLNHFGKRKPYEFLASIGVGYGEKGFIEYRNSGTLFNFRDVPTASQETVDSTLLMVCDITGTSPGRQAVIISGDIDAGKTLERLKLLSMTISRRDTGIPEATYSWNPQPLPYYYFTGEPSGKTATLSVTYNSARVPKKRMNTFQADVTKQYSYYLGIILQRRLTADFRKNGIPLAELRYRYIDSSMDSGDEQHTVTVITSAEKYDQAVSRVAAVLAALDSRGACLEELQDAKDAMFAQAAMNQDGRMSSNHELVQKCVSAYLYGAHLASERSVKEIFTSSKLSGERELELFNNFVSALLDVESNLTLGLADNQESRLPETFDSAWREASADSTARDIITQYGDTLNFHSPKKRVKLRSESADAMTGGYLWTFSNGMKVLFKKIPGKGQFSYGLSIRGGLPEIAGISREERAFASDMLTTMDISGMTGESFRSILEANGITMEATITMSDLRLRGSAPSPKLSLVMKSLLSFGLEHSVNPDAFRRYRNEAGLGEELLRRSNHGIEEKLDSLLCPENDFSMARHPDGIDDGLPYRVGEYLMKQFAKCSDGVLVIAGDLDAENLKKILCASLGDFSTGKQAASRPHISRKYRVGGITMIEDSQDCDIGLGLEGIYLAMTSPLNFTPSNYMALHLAEKALHDGLVRHLKESGAKVDVYSRFEFFPEERITMGIRCLTCHHDGLPEGVDTPDPLVILDMVRKAVSEAAGTKVTDKKLKEYKATLNGKISADYGSPDGIVSAVLTRYAEGRDLMSGYAKNIDSVSSSQILSVLSSLAEGGRVEYILL